MVSSISEQSTSVQTFTTCLACVISKLNYSWWCTVDYNLVLNQRDGGRKRAATVGEESDFPCV